MSAPSAGAVMLRRALFAVRAAQSGGAKTNKRASVWMTDEFEGSASHLSGTWAGDSPRRRPLFLPKRNAKKKRKKRVRRLIIGTLSFSPGGESFPSFPGISSQEHASKRLSCSPIQDIFPDPAPIIVRNHHPRHHPQPSPHCPPPPGPPVPLSTPKFFQRSERSDRRRTSLPPFSKLTPSPFDSTTPDKVLTYSVPPVSAQSPCSRRTCTRRLFALLHVLPKKCWLCRARDCVWTREREREREWRGTAPMGIYPPCM
ncbi:hypothetical protein BS50DRAFT_198106 [Corynespora cassiicola Philippines]|uniref:Uncharacterized protein n=1 Tax=Corynespora cassiicola Philippines TaxID=1448308 RepID=A0A2T2N5U6_CORCC|nr:hypothetical protein BS50DRAFT_198106 [Corynespora cassiicola Philippines]